MIEINVLDGPLAGIEADVLVVLGFEDGAPAAVDRTVSGWASEVYGSGEFSGKPCELATCFIGQLESGQSALRWPGQETRQVRRNRDAKSGRDAVRTLKGRSMRRVHFWLEQPELAQVAVEGAILGDFEPDQLKTDPKKNEKSDRVVHYAVAQGAAGLSDAVRRGRIVAEAQNSAGN